MLKKISEISEHRQALEMLWLCDRAMAATSTGIVIADATKPGRPLIYCNSGFERMTGYSRDEVIGRNCKFLQGSDNDQPAIEQIRQALRDQTECRVILKNYRKDGTLFWNELTISPVFDSNGQLTHFIGVQNDITERVEAEAALKRTTQELADSEAALRKQTNILQSLLDNLAEGVVVADEGGQFVLFNPAAQEVLGKGLINVSSEAWTDQYGCYLPDKLTPYPPQELPLAQAIQGKSVDSAEIFIQPSPNSEGVFICVNARPLKDETGSLKGGVAVFRDITERKRSEVALQQSEAQLREHTNQLKQALHDLQQTQAQLIQSEKMSSLGQLVAGIAHEVNNPVSFIYGNLAYANEYIQDLLKLLNLYQQQYPNPGEEIEEEIEEVGLNFLLEDLPKLMSSMKQGAERIRQIVISLRNFARLDEAEMKTVNIHEGIDSTLLILQHRLKQPLDSEIEIIKEYSKLPIVECYPGQLNQVFINILNNAIDAVEESALKGVEKGQIIIRTGIQDERVFISIADNGAGMSEEVSRHIFEPFYTTKPVGKGTGLGLSISYQVVVEKHGGRLQCISAPGKGTELRIEIPLRQKNLTSFAVPDYLSGNGKKVEKERVGEKRTGVSNLMSQRE
ncbi:PAS domain-containing protein [Microcoleus sp. FACHB-672]|uniref:PAS domain-containing protein n=1 Tax=Microcoleus sp. FACHB-672 TaxID=2692825 RepID=UPI001685DC41|nr:PAS domain-containing protein [Microcoleus sp. FACHB-672]MBD2040940.1 PAS domain-containing protein [Microcoleus sp. FACHB-672]